MITIISRLWVAPRSNTRARYRRCHSVGYLHRPDDPTQFPIPPGQIANPDPKSTTDVSFTADGAWTNCSDVTKPGIAPIVNYLASLPCHPASNCAPGATT